MMTVQLHVGDVAKLAEFTFIRDWLAWSRRRSPRESFHNFVTADVYESPT